MLHAVPRPCGRLTRSVAGGGAFVVEKPTKIAALMFVDETDQRADALLSSAGFPLLIGAQANAVRGGCLPLGDAELNAADRPTRTCRDLKARRSLRRPRSRCRRRRGGVAAAQCGVRDTPGSAVSAPP